MGGHAGQTGLTERRMDGETLTKWSCAEGCPVAVLDAQGPVGITRNVKTGAHYGDADGTETVAAWSCAEGCPVAALDEQSGVLRARGNQTPTKRGSGGIFWAGNGNGVDPVDSGDTGGASRFFKQFVGTLR